MSDPPRRFSEHLPPPRRVKPALLYAAGFAGTGVHLPFFPVWLARQDLEPSAIGALLAIPVLVRILLTAPLMVLLDRGLSPRALLIGANLALALAYAACPFAGGLPMLALAVLAIAVAQAPIIPTADLVALETVRRDPHLDYGRMRLWGSVSFLAASIEAGYAVAGGGAASIVLLLTALALIAAFVAAATIPPVAEARRGPSQEDRPAQAKASIPTGLWLVMAAGACTQASHAALYAFGSIHWSAQGFPGPTIGLLWATGVVAEILLFATLGRSVGPGRLGFSLLMAGAGAGIVRFAAMAADPGPTATFVLQVLHGLSFGATYLGTMAAMNALAPEAARGRAQGALSALTAFATACGTILSGALFHSAGALVFAAMVPLAAAGFGFAFAAARQTGQPQSAGAGGNTRLPS